MKNNGSAKMTSPQMKLEKSSMTPRTRNENKGYVNQVTQKLVADDNICHLPRARPRNSVTQREFRISHLNSPVNETNMPCHHNCEIKQLNAQLKEIKQDKIITLKEIFEVTEQLGRDHPHRRDEVTRSKRVV